MNTPENKFQRNELGLIPSVSYIYNTDGSINWRSMIKPEFLVVQKNHEKTVIQKYNKDLKDLDLREVEDRYLLILLSGIKDILKLRGYSRVDNKVDYVDNKKCVVTCSITFIPNFETNNIPIVFSDVGSASFDSTSGAYRLFIEAIAANRALVRCVRNALGINITGKDEFDEEANKLFNKQSNQDEVIVQKNDFSVNGVLSAICHSHNLTFEDIKKIAEQYKKDMSSNISEWTSLASINTIDSFFLVNKINNLKR
jgi:hypothetical protein